jgi:uncharacterized coiled-coil protein SlyX
MEAHPL